MNYEIKIQGAEEANGTINLNRLAQLAASLQKIAEGALQIRLRGRSHIKRQKKFSLDDALCTTVTGLKEGSTVIALESKQFAETLDNFQMDIFRREAQEQLPRQTPVSLIIATFQDALNDGGDKEYLDKPLLNELKNFKRVLQHAGEQITFQNEGSTPALTLSNNSFKKIKILEEEIPDSKSIVLNGVVEELKYSTLKVRIKTSEGLVDGYLTNDLSHNDIASYFGQEVTIAGMAHYRAGGKYIIEIQRIFTPDENDTYFSKKSKTETVEQQIERQLKGNQHQNRLNEVIGQWPSDEDFDDLLNMLT